MPRNYSIHRIGKTARQMNTQQYIDWDQRRQAMTRAADRADAFLMAGQRTHIYTAVREWTDRINSHCRPEDGVTDPSLHTYSVY